MAHPTSHAWNSCFEDGGECFQTLIPLRTSPLVFSSSAFPQEDKLRLTERDKRSEVCTVFAQTHHIAAERLLWAFQSSSWQRR